MSNPPVGFAYRVRGSGEVQITHHGRVAGTLRGAEAAQFLADTETAGSQELMARLTGNYKHGNERARKEHSRNRRGR